MELIFIFLFGLCLGSFANVLIFRIPEGESVFMPGSHCLSCLNPIRWYDNIPLISYLLLRGKCRNCPARIEIQYPLVELSTALLMTAVYIKFNTAWVSLGYAIFIFFLVVIFMIDLRHSIIPDELSLSLVLAGLLFAPFNNYIGAALLNRILNSALGLICGAAAFYSISLAGEKIYKKEALGGGDIKLVAAIGAFTGPRGLLLSVLAGSFAGVLVSVALIYLFKTKKWNEYLPYGPFLSAGAAVYVLFLI